MNMNEKDIDHLTRKLDARDGGTTFGLIKLPYYGIDYTREEAGI